MRRTDHANTEERRQQLVRAALSSFNALGLHGASIGTICKEAGLSPGHLYYYFENKEALIEAVFLNEWDVGQHYLDALLHRPNCLAIYLGLVPDTSGDLPVSSVANKAFALDVLAEVSRNDTIARINRDHRKQYLAKLAEMTAAARSRGELLDSVCDEAVVSAVDMVATARYVQQAANRYDEVRYRETARRLLEGVINLPAT
jgi:TetR/AcrR family transcriptional repressor of uid operon